MNRTPKVRVLTDISLIVLLLIAMANLLTENLIHEIAGLAMCIAILYHTALNIKWYKSLLRGRYNLHRIINSSINIMLVAASLLLVATSILVSQSLFGFLELESSLFVQTLHTTAAYWLVILTGAHLGIHWHRFVKVIKYVLSLPDSGIRYPLVKWLLALLTLAHGIYSSFERDIGTKLFRGDAYGGYWDFESSVAGYFIHLLAVIGLYAVCSHNLIKIIQRKRRKKTNTRKNKQVPTRQQSLTIM